MHAAIVASLEELLMFCSDDGMKKIHCTLSYIEVHHMYFHTTYNKGMITNYYSITTFRIY